MKKDLLLFEKYLKSIVNNVIVETHDESNHPGRYYILRGLYFYVDDDRMYLADKSTGELSPNMSVEFPSTNEISAIWTSRTQEYDDENIKGIELKNLDFDEKMKNAIKYGKYLQANNQEIANIGTLNPIIFYSRKYRAPSLGGFIISSEYPESIEGPTTLIDPIPGNKIYFQQSAFKKGKEFGIRLDLSTYGEELNLKDFGINQNMLRLPKTFNIGDFFEENSAIPKNIDKASFVEMIKEFIKKGGKINKVSVIASTSKVPAGHVDNDTNKSKWIDVKDFDTVVNGNNDDNTGNLQLTKAKSFNTYSHLKKHIPELTSAPYVLKANGPSGEYVHVRFE